MKLRMISILVLVPAWLSLGSRVLAQDSDPYFYYYLEERVSLRVTPGVVAVFDRTPGPVDLLPRLVEDVGLPNPLVEPHPIRGWYLVHFDESSADAPPDIPSLIEQLIEHETAGRFFFSPVFISPSGESVIVTPEVLVQFEPGVGPDEVDRLLREGGVRGGTVEPFVPVLENSFRVRTNERSGIVVLSISNRLHEMPEVIFASPNRITTGRGGGPVPADVPTLSPLGLLSLATVLGAAALALLARRSSGASGSL